MKRATIKRQLESRILAAAIKLFGKFSYQGATVRGLAKTADCTVPSIFRLFVTKERLYEEAIRSVVQGSVNSMAAFALKLHTIHRGKKDFDSNVIRSAVHAWYFSFSPDGARLVQQVILSDTRRRTQVQQAFDNILAILEARLEQVSKETGKNFAPKTRSESLIRTLFQLKISNYGRPRSERQEVDRYIDNWLSTLPAEVRDQLSR